MYAQRPACIRTPYTGLTVADHLTLAICAAPLDLRAAELIEGPRVHLQAPAVPCFDLRVVGGAVIFLIQRRDVLPGSKLEVKHPAEAEGRKGNPTGRATLYLAAGQ